MGAGRGLRFNIVGSYSGHILNGDNFCNVMARLSYVEVGIWQLGQSQSLESGVRVRYGNGTFHIFFDFPTHCLVSLYKWAPKISAFLLKLFISSSSITA